MKMKIHKLLINLLFLFPAIVYASGLAFPDGVKNIIQSNIKSSEITALIKIISVEFSDQIVNERGPSFKEYIIEANVIESYKGNPAEKIIYYKMVELGSAPPAIGTKWIVCLNHTNERVFNWHNVCFEFLFSPEREIIIKELTKK